MRQKEKLIYRIKCKQLINQGKENMRSSCPILATLYESLKEQNKHDQKRESKTIF